MDWVPQMDPEQSFRLKTHFLFFFSLIVLDLNNYKKKNILYANCLQKDEKSLIGISLLMDPVDESILKEKTEKQTMMQIVKSSLYQHHSSF